MLLSSLFPLRSDVDEVGIFANPKMIKVHIWFIELPPIIMLIVNAKSAHIPIIILTYKPFNTVQMRGIILVGAIEVLRSCKFLQFNHYFSVIQAVNDVAADAVLRKGRIFISLI